MDDTPRNGSQLLKKPIFIGIFLLVASILFYWEFINDIHPTDAIRYYDMETKVPNSDNAAFALWGIKAPEGTIDFHTWGQSESKKRDWPNKTLEIHTSEWNENYNCWLPWGTNEQGENPRCITKERLAKLIGKNQLALKRYSKILKYSSLVAQEYGVMSHASIELSKQYSTILWQRRNDMSTKYIDSVINFLRFWSSVLRTGYLDEVGFSIASVNYGLAFGLFTAIATQHPKLILLYGKKQGGFEYHNYDEDLIRRLNIGSFYLIDSSLCISHAFGFRNSNCEERPKSLLYKPGRTIKRIFDSRVQISDCKNVVKSTTKKNPDSSWQQVWELIGRPGNFEGNQYLQNFYSAKLNCDLYKYFRSRNSQLGLFNLYLTLKASNLTPDEINSAYKSGSNMFKVPFAENHYYWDAAKRKLGLKDFWPNHDSDFSFAID